MLSGGPSRHRSKLRGPNRPGDIRDVDQDEYSVRCGGLQARYLAAADGLHSPIRRQLGLDRPSGRGRRWGIRRHFHIAPWSDTVEVYWAAHTEAYVTPVSDDCVGGGRPHLPAGQV